MNSPIIIALTGSIFAIVTYYLASKVSNKWLKNLLQLASVIFAIFLIAAMSASGAVSAKSGEYFFYIMVAVAIGSKLFGKKKERSA